MTNDQFEQIMKSVLGKAETAADISYYAYSVSTDPDVEADYGVDRDGNLVIDGEKLPLKVSDITDVRYKYYEGNEDTGTDLSIRFDFGENNYLRRFIIYEDYPPSPEREYEIRFNGQWNIFSRQKAIDFLSLSLTQNTTQEKE